jgi:hypothetical protein
LTDAGLNLFWGKPGFGTALTQNGIFSTPNHYGIFLNNNSAMFLLKKLSNASGIFFHCKPETPN